MSAIDARGELPVFRISVLWTLLFMALAGVGAAAFLAGLRAGDSARLWQAYLVNFVFWTGLSFGAVLFVAILNMANAQWGRPLKRLAESIGSFLPASFLLFWGLYAGREEIFPWILKPVHGKEAWLNPGFMFARDGIAHLLLTAVSAALIYFSLRADRAALRSGPSGVEGIPDPSGADRNWRAQQVLSPLFAVLYAFILSLFAFDLIMSLDPHWYSTLFGGYYFMTSFYLALAALALLSHATWKPLGLGNFLRPKQFHDLGKLVFGFCVFSAYLFFVQLMVIWYGNISEETEFLILRVRSAPWAPLAWTILVTAFAIPFLLLLTRSIKMRRGPMIGITAAILVGVWLERFLWVAPSLWHREELPLGFPEIAVTAGFLGIMGLCIFFFLKSFPLLPLADPLFRKHLREREKED